MSGATPDPALVGGDRLRGPARRRGRLGPELDGVRRRGRVGSHRALAEAEPDRDRGQPRRDATEHEHERDPAEPLGSQRTDRRPDQQPAHLHRAVQPECLASPLRRRRIGQVAARGRVVQRGRQPGPGAQEDERQRADEDERQQAEHAGRDQPDDHQRHPRGPVREPAEDRLADEPGSRPRRDDDAEQRQVDALLGEVDRQDRQQRTEPEPHDELAGEERDDPPQRSSQAAHRRDRDAGRIGRD